VANPIDAFRLDGKVVVLTGASSGLGVGFAHALAGAGADLVLAARREDRLVALAAELEATGRRVVVQRADVGDPDDCAALARRAAEELGRIDVLVNNAGAGGAVPASRETAAGFGGVLAVNLTGAFCLAQACAPHMPPGSSIVNIASALAHVASRLPQTAYVSSKAGMVGMTRALAQEWTARLGIRVNALCPGYFRTEMTEAGGDRLREDVERQTMMGRFGEQAELDGALLFLASPASSYVTGSSLLVDGGLTAW
jgi:NAD(P)-dependent dehydrogenase (short-subunit alcohol dehydrogenase family)